MKLTPLQHDVKTRPRKSKVDDMAVTRIEFGDMVESLTSTGSARILATETWRYEGGTTRVYDYNTPATYQKYSPVKSSPNASSTINEPYMRHGHDNRYPFFILKFTKKSATFQSAFGTAKNVAAGSGFNFVNLNEVQQAALEKWMQDKEIDRDAVEEMASSICLFGGSYQLLVVTKTGKGKIEFTGMDRQSFQNLRVGKPEPDGRVGRHWHSLLYNQNRIRNDLRGIPVWRGVDDVIANFEERFVIEVGGKNFSVAVGEDALVSLGKWSHLVANSNMYSDFNPSPAWESDAAINATLLEDAILAGDIANMENGMTAGYIISVPYAEDRDPVKNTENKAKIEGKIRNDLQGVENKGKIVVVYQDPRAVVDGIKIAPIPHINTSDMSLMMEERKDQVLLTAWRIPDSRLIGIPPRKGKSLNNEAASLAEADDNWYVNFIKPEIVAPIEKFLNRVILRIYEAETGVMLPAGSRIEVKRMKRFSFRPSDPIQEGFFGTDEVRAMYGYGPADDEVKAEIKERNMKTQSNGTTDLPKL